MGTSNEPIGPGPAGDSRVDANLRAQDVPEIRSLLRKMGLPEAPLSLSDAPEVTEAHREVMRRILEGDGKVSGEEFDEVTRNCMHFAEFRQVQTEIAREIAQARLRAPKT